MRPGTKPKPTWLKVIAGNPGCRPLNTNEPDALAVGELVNMPVPEDFTPEMAAVWAATLAAAPPGLLANIDQAVLIVFVTAKWAHMDAVKHVTKYGMMIRAPITGVPMHNPYLNTMNAQAKIMLRAAAEMGFTPSSRSRVSVNPKRKGTAQGGFDDLKDLGD